MYRQNEHMKQWNQKFKSWIALGVCICFIATLFPEAHAALPSIEMAVKAETPRILNIDIPTELATVDEWYQAPSKSKPKLIVHIQDAHANYEAQTKIRDVIKYLNTNYGFKTILVEGAASELDPNILKLFPDQERNVKLADELAKIGEVTGAEMFLIENSDAAKGVGIEKPELYRRNFDALQKVYSEDGFVSSFFEAYEKKLGQISSRSFGPRMIQALAEWRKFESGHRDFLPFVSALAEISKKVLEVDLGVLYSQIEWPQLTRLLVLQRVEKELEARRAELDSRDAGLGTQGSIKERALVEKQQIVELLRTAKASTGLIEAIERFDEKTANLNRIGSSEVRQASAPRALMEALVEEGGTIGFDIREYPAFAKFAGYLILRGEIVPADLFEEIKKLFDLVLESLVKDAPSAAVESSDDLAARKRLLLLHRDEMLARKLLKLELTHDEWLAVLSRQDRFYPDDLNRRMLEQLGQNTRLKEIGGEEAAQMKKLNEAFRAAFTFYSAAVNRDTYFFQRTQEVLAQTDKAILITGGFHAEGMKYFFRKYDINYGTLTPRITQEFSNEQYRKVMMTGAEVTATNDQRLSTIENAKPSTSEVKANHLGGGGGSIATPSKKKSVKENYLGAGVHLNANRVELQSMEGAVRSEARREVVRSEARKLGFSAEKDGKEISLAVPVQVSDLDRLEPRAMTEDVFVSQGILSVSQGQRALMGAGIGMLGLAVAYFAAAFFPALLLLAISVTAAGIIYGFDQYFKARYKVFNRSEGVAVDESQSPILSATEEEVEVEVVSFFNKLDGIQSQADLVIKLDNLRREAKSMEDIQALLAKIREFEREMEPQEQIRVQVTKVRLAMQLETIRKSNQAQPAVPEVVVVAKAPPEAIFAALSLKEREILSRMNYYDLENQINGDKNLSASQEVTIYAVGGLISPADHDAAKQMAELASLAVTKVASAQTSEMTEMLKSFFPDFVSVDRGYLIQILNSDEWNKERAQALQMFLAFNPAVKIDLIVVGKQKPEFLKRTARFELHSVENDNKVASVVTTLKTRNWSIRALVALPETMNIALKSGDRTQVVFENYSRLNQEYFMAAAHSKIRAAQKIVAGQELVVQAEDGIRKYGSRYVIDDKSLAGVVASIALKYLSALQISRSA